MAIRKILTEPDPFLRQKSSRVDEVSDEILFKHLDSYITNSYNTVELHRIIKDGIRLNENNSFLIPELAIN